MKGDLTVSIGSGLYTAASAAFSALLLFSLAIYLVHKSLWSKIVYLVLLFLLVGGGAAFVYIGINSP